jgi:GT2 family glycosyltransferase
MSMTPDATLGETLCRRSNMYDPYVQAFQDRTRHDWHRPTPASLGQQSVSVVIPAHDMAHSISAVLDGLVRQRIDAPVEVIVVDDGSTDGTADLAARHQAKPCVIRLPSRHGAGVARNAGTAAASHDTVLFLDADMVLPSHALADVSARADAGLVLLGFRHNVPCPQPAEEGIDITRLPPRLEADHRVRWRPPVGVPLLYSGITLAEPLDGEPLDATDDLRMLGFGRTYYDWDLPRMVVTALVAAPRAAVVDVGGFDARFAVAGWGSEDTHLGAKLIAAGLMVVPLRQLVGLHLDPPDAAASWAAKLRTWPNTIALYRRLLDEPPPHGQSAAFFAATEALLARTEVVS